MLTDYQIQDDPHYLFICARLTERERDFIDKGRWERLINASNTEDFLKVLQETYYGKYVADIEKTGNMQQLIIKENQEMLSLLKDNLREEHGDVKEFYLLRLDLHNIKIIMKSVMSGKDMSDIFHPFSYSYQDLREAYENKKYGNIDPETVEILEYAQHLAGIEKNQRIRELHLEKFYLKKIYSHFSKLGSPMILDLLKHTIDMYNIKNIYRAKLLDEKVHFDSFLYANGFIPISELVKYEQESTDYFIQSIENTPYIKMIFQGGHMFQKQHTFAAFERNEDEFVLKFMETVKFSVANLEKVVYFMLKKRTELKHLNIALTGAMYSIDKNRIKNRIIGV